MALDGLIRAALAGTTGYLAGRDLREQRQQAEADKAYERERQARQDALMAELHRAQKEAAEALAIQRRTPDAPPVRNIDPLSPEGIQAAADRAARIEAIRAKVRGTGGGSLTPTQQRQLAEDEAEGLAILSSNPVRGNPNGEAIIRDFGKAYREARRANPTMSPGRLAKQVYEGLKAAEPEMFRAPRTDTALSTVDRILQFAGIGGAPPTTAVPSGYTPDARARFNAGQRPAPASQPTESVAALPPLRETSKARARTDPGFAAFLTSKGYTEADWQ